jgi:hypothetical protein
VTIFGAIGFAAGLGAAGSSAWAAWLWYRASKVQVTPLWVAAGSEPADPQQSQQGWIVGLLTASTDSATLNARAARWTGAAVALTATRTIAGLLVSGIQ